jgi:hypothetical protein
MAFLLQKHKYDDITTKHYSNSNLYGADVGGTGGGIDMRRAIWLPAGEIVIVRRYDEHNETAVIEHDGRWETVAAGEIHLLAHPDYSEVNAESEG